jgi:poly-gamma-glutamate capsule biosynthesis protein CapA/YwtB (metallophosphatase superfamily)
MLHGDVEHRQSKLVERTLEHIAFSSAQFGTELVRVEDESDASFVFGHQDEAEGSVFITGEPLVAIVRTDQRVAEVFREDITRLMNGEIQNWAELGGQDWIVHPVVLEGSAAPFEAEAQTSITLDEVGGQFSEHPGLITLIPRSLASFTMQTLIVDDVDPLRDELTAENWPWWEEIQLRAGDDQGRLVSIILEELRSTSDKAHAERRTMISVTGDVMLGRTPHRIMVERGDWTAPFPLVADELQKGDLTIGNLECAITDSFTPPADPTTFSFMTFTDAVEGLQYAGYHALSGANNHALDFGVVGMQDTTAALESVGIQHFGTGNTLEEARQPCLLEHEGITFGFLGYDAISMNYAAATPQSGGVAPLIREYVEEDIQRTREIADVVIPYFHWGVEYTLTPTENDRRMAHAAVDAGADLVLGGHPHWVQGMEIYNDTAIFYSTSNFVFDQEWSFETKQGFVLHLIFDGVTLVGYRVVPVLIEDFHRPRIVDDEVRSTILGRFWESSSIIASTPLS